MRANFGDPRSRDRKLRHKKNIKKCDFWLEIYYFAYNSKTTWCAQLKFVRNVGAYNGLCKLSLGEPGHVTKMLPAENGPF